jgi:response regulator RpfG family c-di-GMP phosphodiesterase
MNKIDKPLRVLMVEDSEDDEILIIKEIKKNGFDLFYERVETAAAMKSALQDKQWDVILCDFNLPQFNAPAAIAVLREENIDIPLIVLSGTVEDDAMADCMRVGARDYIVKGNLSRLGRIIARELQDTEVKNKYKQTEEMLNMTIDRLKKVIGASLQVIVSAVENREPYLRGHQLRSANLACAIATEMGLDQNKIDGIKMAGSIYEIGNIGIPFEILSKPGRLTDIEIALIKEHTRNGYEMLKDVESPWPLAEIVYQHHERMNGSGYPRRLSGDEIFIESRVLAVSDVVESMASRRPYRPALSFEVALEEIEKNKGILYDSDTVNTCLKLFREGKNGYQ